MPKKSKPESVPSVADSRDRLTDRKRAAIVQAAVEAFHTYGYYAASMDGIAKRASVSKRTLYNHFASKEALFDAIVEELFTRVEQLPACEFDPSRELGEQLTELARTEVNFLISEDVQALARAGLSRVLAEPEVGRQVDHRRLLRRVETWFQQAQAAGFLIEADEGTAAMQFIGLLRTFAFWPMILHGEAPPTEPEREAIVASTVEMFLRRYATQRGR